MELFIPCCYNHFCFAPVKYTPVRQCFNTLLGTVELGELVGQYLFTENTIHPSPLNKKAEIQAPKTPTLQCNFFKLPCFPFFSLSATSTFNCPRKSSNQHRTLTFGPQMENP
uniref:Uncharacterized protein n=1 Tax=Opuntia streptacantha TaxID=393608 RepID=A0A7C9CLC6_OPUST